MGMTLPAFTDEQLLLAKANSFIRWQCCRLLTRNEHAAAQLFAERFANDMYGTMFAKAATNPGVTIEPSWAAPLALARPLAQGMSAFVLPTTTAGQMLQLPMGALLVPFNTSVGVPTAGGTFRFVGQGAPAPVTNMQMTGVTLAPTKTRGIFTISGELSKLATPSAEAVIRNDFVRGIRKAVDEAFLDPTNTGIANEKPASILANAPSFGSAGSSAANVLTDLNRLIREFYLAHPHAVSPVFIMSPATASAAINATGERNLNVVTGGTLLGMPTLITPHIGNRLALVDAAQVLIADDGDLLISTSKHATLELDTAPTSPVTASTTHVSLWPLNLIGIDATKWINWRLANNYAARWTTVNYV